MSELSIFNYQDTPVRTVVIDGEPWFVLADLAKVLGIRDVQRLNSRLDDGVRQTHPIQDSLGRTQNATIVSEPGMYEVVIRSDKPEAVAFRRWITSEVLPQIRRTGSYGVPALSEDEIVHQALQISARKVKALEAKVAEDAPKVEYVDTFCADEDTLKFRTVASDLGVSETELRNLLIRKGWIYKETSRRFSETKGRVEERNRYSEYAHKKPYFYRRMDQDAPRFRGEVMWTLKITPAGAAAITRLMKKQEAAA